MIKVLLTIITAATMGVVCRGGEGEKPLAPFMANPSAEKADGQSALGFSAFTKTGSQYQWSAEAARTGSMGLRMIFKKDLEYRHAVFELSGLNLKPDRLYCFSVYYRTRQEKPQIQVFEISLEDYVSKSPSSTPDWTRATFVFPGEVNASLRLFSLGTQHGWQMMGKDAAGKPLLLGRIDLNIDLDDFDLRELTDKDFEGSVVENGDFEQGDSFPANWSTPHPDNIFIDDKIKHSGKQSLRIDIVDKGKDGVVKGGGVQSGFLPMKSDKIYVISFWMKAKEATNDKVEICLFGGSKGQGWTERYLWQKRVMPATTEWEKYEFYLETPKEGDFNYQGEQFVSWLSMGTYYAKISNSVWIDDIRCEPMKVE